MPQNATIDFSAYETPTSAGGPLTPGNIDLYNRPHVKNPDGSVSTVRSMSFGENGKEILVPTVSEDGRIMSEKEAIDTYHKTGKHLGIFNSPESATTFAKQLHEDYASGKYDQPKAIDFSAYEEKPPQAGVAARTAYGVGRGIANLVGGAYQTVRHPIDTATGLYTNAAEHISQAQEEPSTIGKIAEYGAAIPMLGPLGKSLGERAATGDYAGAIAEGLTTAAAPSVMADVVPRLPGRGALRDALGRLVRDPDVLEYPKTAKSLRTPVKAVASMGKMVGGPEIANMLTPAHPEAPQGPYAKLPVRIPRNAIAARAAAAAKAAESVAVKDPVSPDVTIYPEPRVAGPTERPGAMYSVPREQLPGLAASGAPGAADVLRATGKPILFEPKEGTGYGGPRAAAQTPAEFAAQPAASITKNVSRDTIPTISTDSMGIKWAEGENGIRVSIPKRIPEGEVAAYAQTKLAEQAAAQEKIKATPTGVAESMKESPKELGFMSMAEFLRRKRVAAGTTTLADSATSEASRLGLGNLSSLEQRYVSEIMNSPEYAKLSDAAKKAMIEKRVMKLGGK